MGAAEAAAPDAESIWIDFRLQRQPGQSVVIIVHLVAGNHSPTRFAATGSKTTVVKHQNRDAGRGETTGKWLELHFLDCTETMSHSNGR
jgi:hypothetical protein